MPLIPAVVGGRWPPQLAIWQAGDEPANLSGAEITGKLRNRATETTRDIAGTISVTDAGAGEFLWQYAVEDVAEAGEFDVQFIATFPGQDGLVGKSYIDTWTVRGSL